MNKVLQNRINKYLETKRDYVYLDHPVQMIDAETTFGRSYHYFLYYKANHMPYKKFRTQEELAEFLSVEGF